MNPESAQWVQLINEHIQKTGCSWDDAWARCPALHQKEYKAMMQAGRTQEQVALDAGLTVQPQFGGGVLIGKPSLANASGRLPTMSNVADKTAARDALIQATHERMDKFGEDYTTAFRRADAQLANSAGFNYAKQAMIGKTAKEDPSVGTPDWTLQNCNLLHIPYDHSTQEEFLAAWEANGKKLEPCDYTSVFPAMVKWAKSNLNLSDTECAARYRELANGFKKGWKGESPNA